MYSEFLKYSGSKTIKWFSNVFSNIPILVLEWKYFKHNKALAVLKLGKPENDISSYRPISLLSIYYKLLERLLYNRKSENVDKTLLQ